MHGTSTDVSTLIISENFRKANVAYFGPGIYMTDMLDYAGFYAYDSNDDKEKKFNNHHRIRKANEIFSIVASQVFYDNSKFENCYNKTNKIIKEKGIRYVHVDANVRPLSKDKTKENRYINLLDIFF